MEFFMKKFLFLFLFLLFSFQGYALEIYNNNDNKIDIYGDIRGGVDISLCGFPFKHAMV